MRRPTAWLSGAPTMIAVAVATLVGAWWFKAHCVTGDGLWQRGEKFATGCYTDVVALWRGRDLVEGAVPYLDSAVEYPVLTGAQMWAAARVTRTAVGAGDHVFAFLTVTAVVNAALLLLTLWVLWRMGVPRSRLWWLAAAPPVVLYAAHNWDPAAVLLMTAAIALHVRGRDGLAGVAAGLGTAAKLFPGIVIPLVAATRLAQGRRRDAMVHVGLAAAAWLAVNLPVAFAVPDNWSRFYRLSGSRAGTFASTWTMLERATGWTLEVGPRNLLAALAFVLGAGIIFVLGWRRHRDRAYVLALPLLCWFLLSNKVYSPQFDLWLVPLMVIALPSVRQYLAFVAADAFVYATELGFLGRRAGVGGNPYWLLGIATSLRVVVLCWIIVSCLRQPSPSSAPSTADPVVREDPHRIRKKSPMPQTLPSTGTTRP